MNRRSFLGALAAIAIVRTQRVIGVDLGAGFKPCYYVGHRCRIPSEVWRTRLVVNRRGR